MRFAYEDGEFHVYTALAGYVNQYINLLFVNPDISLCIFIPKVMTRIDMSIV